MNENYKDSKKKVWNSFQIVSIIVLLIIIVFNVLGTLASMTVINNMSDYLRESSKEETTYNMYNKHDK